MRQFLTYGSVRGVPGNRHPYRAPSVGFSVVRPHRISCPSQHPAATGEKWRQSRFSCYSLNVKCNMGALTMRLPDELQKMLEEFCRQQHRSSSDVVRESLRRHFAQEQLRQLREKLRPYAEAKGLLTDEDVFRTVS